MNIQDVFHKIFLVGNNWDYCNECKFVNQKNRERKTNAHRV